MWESFIIHQVFYSLFTLVWQHPSFQLTNSLVSYDRIINQSFNAQVKFKQLWCSLVSLWSLMHSVTIPTQWMDYTWNYALKSALLPHANTQSPDVTEYNWSLWQWPACFYKPVLLIHMQYTLALWVTPQQCWVSQRTAAHCRE